MTRSEAAARLGVAEEFVLQLWRAAGLADPRLDAPILAPDDLELFDIFNTAQALFDRDVTMQVFRVVGEACRRITDASMSVFRMSFTAPALAEQRPPEEIVSENVAFVEEALPLLLRAVDRMIRLHFIGSFRPLEELLGHDDVETRSLAIGFADLVGSTKLSESLTVTEVAAFMRRFEEIASEIVLSRGGRVVKWIGDEVMFVAADSTVACRIGLDLVATFADDPLVPPVRAGVSAGEVACRGGDFFGMPVNLAARLLELATPGQVLVPESLGRGMAADLIAAPVGTHRLKGIGNTVEVVAISAGGRR